MLTPCWEQTNNIVTDTLIRPLVALLHQFAKKARDSVAAVFPTPEQVGEIPIKLASTTVVTNNGKKRDDVGSDSDEQWLDGCGGKRTSRDERDEKAQVFQAGKRRVGESPEC